MELRFNVKKLCVFLYTLIISIYYVADLAYVEYSNLKYLVFIAIFPAVIKLLKQAETKREFLISGLILFLGALVFYKTSESTVLIITCTVLIMKDVDSKFPCKVLLWTYVIGAILIFLFCLFGIIPDNIVIMGDRYRHSFGFAHPNILAMSILNIIMLKIYVYGIKNYYLECIIYALVSAILYYLSDSRTVALISAIMIVLILFINYSKNSNKILKRACLVLLFIGFFSLYLFVNYRNIGIIKNIDKLLNSRITLFNRFYDAYGLSFFGTDIWAKPLFEYYVLDQGYANILIRFGLAGVVAIISGFLLLINKYEKYNKYFLMICFLILLYGFSENIFTTLNRNFLWFAIGENIYSEISKKNKGVVI